MTSSAQTQTKKKGYYFTLTHTWKLGQAGFMLSDYYNGFIEEDTFKNSNKITLGLRCKSIPVKYQIVEERNPTSIEDNYHELTRFEKPTFLSELIFQKTETKQRLKNKKRSKIELQIVYGTFQFEEHQTTVKKYEEGYMSSSHVSRRLNLTQDVEITVLKLIRYNDLRALSESELKKIKVKNNQ